MTFKLTEKQIEANNIFASDATHILTLGGSRCVSGDTILDGQTKTIKQLAEEGKPIEVITSWGKQLAEAPYKKGSTAMLKVSVESGETITVTPDHRFFDGTKWIKAQDLKISSLVSLLQSNLPQSNLESFQLKFLSDVQHLKGTLLSYLDDCLLRHRQCDAQPHPYTTFYQAYCALQSDEEEHNREYQYPAFLSSLLHGLDTHTQNQEQLVLEYIHSYPELFHHSKKDVFQDSYLDEQLLNSFYEQIFLSFQDLQKKYQLIQKLSFQEQLVQLVQSGLIHQFYQFLNLSFDTPNSLGYSVSRVTEISTSPIEDYYTLHVPLTEQYFANGFLNHNSGKTFLIVRNIILRALKADNSRHAIFRNTFASVKASIQNDTLPKVMKLAFPEVSYSLNKTESIFTFSNGSQIILAGLDDSDRIEKILGMEFVTIYLNESSQISYYSRNIVLTRLAQKVYDYNSNLMKPRFYYDMNPSNKSHWTYKLFIQKLDPDSKQPIINPDNYKHFQINPIDNTDNISEGYLDSLREQSIRLQRRFLYGEFTDDNSEALFTDINIETNRFMFGELPQMLRIVIAVDPSGSSDSSEGNDAVGIIVAGLGSDGIVYVLEDLTIKASPNVWSKVISDAYERNEANLVVAETNYGGGMVEMVIRTHNPRIPFKALTSTRGKHIRAEPVATLYEQGKVKHVGNFLNLEDELCCFTSTGYTGDRSPNRADALVFAISELFNGVVNPRVKREDRVVNTGLSYNRKQSGWQR